ncbi:hypothetical protein M514_02475 [Trichuris suis]|uniref:Uncharacterized protein n=1 Tax=Trichuris suis TaxID=68888 RepID=A0A085NF98_9BILA|nr:hypothetical protein M513_02475 [Trichuris suis]KFD68144.1 hypothetical protein M514_02475 [Trichuris suis]
MFSGLAKAHAPVDVYHFCFAPSALLLVPSRRICDLRIDSKAPRGASSSCCYHRELADCFQCVVASLQHSLSLPLRRYFTNCCLMVLPRNSFLESPLSHLQQNQGFTPSVAIIYVTGLDVLLSFTALFCNCLN